MQNYKMYFMFSLLIWVHKLCILKYLISMTYEWLGSQRNGLMCGKGIYFFVSWKFSLGKVSMEYYKWNTKLRSRNKGWAENKPHLAQYTQRSAHKHRTQTCSRNYHEISDSLFPVMAHGQLHPSLSVFIT